MSQATWAGHCGIEAIQKRTGSDPNRGHEAIADLWKEFSRPALNMRLRTACYMKLRQVRDFKALLHVAAVMDEVSHMADLGVDFGAPVTNFGKLTGGLAAMAKMRKVTIVRGYGTFVGTNHVEVEETSGNAQDKTGAKKVIAFKKAIIAAGSQAVRLPFMPEDPRVVDSTGALELKEVPKRMQILGGGIIGLEMGTNVAWMTPGPVCGPVG